MPVFTTNDSIVYFAHVPKAGGTSLENWIRQTYGNLTLHEPDWTRRWKKGGWLTSSRTSSLQHLTWQDTFEHLDGNPDHVIAIVRDPVDRLVSEFRFQSTHMRRRAKFAKFAKIGFSAWLRATRVATMICPHFIDNHFRPQTSFFPPSARVFKLEEGLDLPVRHLKNLYPTPQDSPIGRHLTSSAPKPLVAPADASLIADWFTSDYETLAYAPPEPYPYSISTLDRARGLKIARQFRVGRF